jgi:hypothetical protein
MAKIADSFCIPGVYEVVTADGCLSDRCCSGPMVVNGLSSAERLGVDRYLFGPAPTP